MPATLAPHRLCRDWNRAWSNWSDYHLCFSVPGIVKNKHFFNFFPQFDVLVWFSNSWKNVMFRHGDIYMARRHFGTDIFWRHWHYGTMPKSPCGEMSILLCMVPKNPFAKMFQCPKVPVPKCPSAVMSLCWYIYGAKNSSCRKVPMSKSSRFKLSMCWNFQRSWNVHGVEMSMTKCLLPKYQVL